LRLSLTLLLCLLISLLRGQAPVAQFSASSVSGCSPLVVSFTDQSTGSPVSWNWDFGNGQLSNVKNPAVAFTPGTYTITLVVRNASGINSITKTNYIVSNPSPKAGFDADKKISCLPGTIQFQDLSVPNAGTINKWEWDFGDGQKSSAQSPSHAYSTAGFYDVYLKVTSTTGCSDASSAARFIRMVNGVKADFNPTGPTTCLPPFAVTYNNLTSGPGTLTYTWDLGNATTSTQTSPVGSYAAAGTYTVKLSAVSDFGCSDAIQKTVPINGSTTTFQTVGGKDSICLGSPISFKSTAVPPPSKIVWDFGDGTSFTGLTPPAKTYAAAGIYTVTMSATYPSCNSTATKQITVSDKPIVDFFSANNNSFCKAPAAVLFQNISPDVATATWDFGDGSTGNSVGTAPITHIYNTGNKNYTVKLTITSSKGCSNTVSKTNYVNILAPNAHIKDMPAGVCKNQSFSLSNDGGNVDGIATYDWDFGDGSAIDHSANPTHAYIANGNYTVKLTINTNGGCTATDTKGPIIVGPPPVVDFNKVSTTDCRSAAVAFSNLTAPLAPTTYLWDFGDGASSTSTSPSHKFLDTGYFTIKLVASLNGCADSITKSGFVHIQPPVANFGYEVKDCANKTNVTFSDTSLTDAAYGPITYKWSFGDPANTISNLAPPAPVTFNYPSLGAFNVQLIVNNGACVDSLTKTIQLENEKANFLMDKPSYCRNEKINFVSTNNISLVRTFNWIIDNAPFITDQPRTSASYPLTGNHTAQLTITTVDGCSNTSPVTNFSVTGPTALFTTANKGGCANSTVTFNDASTSSGTLIKWVFDFGDGSSQTFTAPPFTHKYKNTGNYIVKLTVYDNTSASCSDTYADSTGTLITKPSASFGVDKTAFCPGVPLQFTDSSSGGGLSYTWDFGDGGTDNIQNPLHSYAYTGKDSLYSVKLMIKDSVGCSDTLTRLNYISVRMPKALYAVKDTATLCPPLETKFTFLGKDVDSFYWDFGDGGSPSTLAAPNHFYNNYGKFTAKLYVTGYGGCVDSAGINITLTDPIAATSVNFVPNPATACNNLTVNFTVTPPYSTKFQLFFGDGNADSSQQTTVSHYYSLPNNYSPFVKLEDSVGCKIVKGGLGSVNILGAVPLFGADKKKFCDSGLVYLTDYSQDGNDNIVTRTWDFGDGTPPVVLPKDAQHNYTKPGLFIPTLSVTTVSGCSQSFTDTVRVLATPDPIINSAAGVCNDSSLSFHGSLRVPPDTATTWKWDFGGGKTSDLQDVAVHFADTGIHHITVQATNSLGCKGDTTKDIIVYPLPAITVSGDTTTVSGGVGITIPLTYSPNTVSYSWTPEADLSCTDCPNPFANPKFTTTYNVKVRDDKGCTSTRNLTLVVTCNNKNFFIPNTFSPNNDGANDRFYPRGTGLNLIQALRVFNRWGELVFEKRNFPANDASSGWDGTYRGKAAATDTYIYMIDIICDNANVITYKGNITLIR
jgi:gliding motility-associated-like protein